MTNPRHCGLMEQQLLSTERMVKDALEGISPSATASVEAAEMIAMGERIEQVEFYINKVEELVNSRIDFGKLLKKVLGSCRMEF